MTRPAICHQCSSTRIALRRLKPHHKAYKKRKEWPFVYTCSACGAECGVKTGTIHAGSIMADGATRYARTRAHDAFDLVWSGRGKNKIPRGVAYRHLAAYMGMTSEQCHIGMMDLAQCEDVIKYSAIILRQQKRRTR